MKLIVAGAVMLALWLLNVSYNLDLFYNRGAALYDAGWFAWLASHADAWPMTNPAAIGGNYLSIHMATLFFASTPVLRQLALPDALRFALLISIWAPLLWLAFFLLLARLRLWPRIALALLLTFNGLSLAMLGFPHIEILIPSLGLLAIALLVRARGPWSWLGFCVVLGLVLSIREDAGLHIALPLLAMAVATGGWRNRYLAAAGLGIFAGAATLAVQKLTLPAGAEALGTVYLGHPAFAQLSMRTVFDRLRYWLTRRAYVFVPLAMLAPGRTPAIGILVALPWLALSLIAANQPAGNLWDYYGFPLVFAFVWPLLLAQVASRFRLRLQLAMGGVSTALFVVVGLLPFVGDGGSHDRAPWTHLVPPSETRIRATQAALAAVPDALLDDGAASLALDHSEPWQNRIDLGFTEADIARASRFIRFQTHPAYLAPRIDALQKRFPTCTPIVDTALETCVH